MSSTLLNFFLTIAVVSAVPSPSVNDSAEDSAKYTKDKGAVLSYIFGAAGCLIVLGVIYFAYCKWKRGRRALEADKRTNTHNVFHHTADHHRNTPVVKWPELRRNFESRYGAANPYAWPGHPQMAAPRATNLQASDLNKELPQVPKEGQTRFGLGLKKPASVARPSHQIQRKPVFVPAIQTIAPDSAGYYHVPL